MNYFHSKFLILNLGGECIGIVGYIFGCLLSIILWQIDRKDIFFKVNEKLKKIFKNNLTWVQVFYVIVFIILSLLLNKLGKVLEYNGGIWNEVFNAITAFIVIDISNAEKKNLKLNKKIQFYDTISIITRGIVCGFIAPLFFIMLFGNSLAIIYMIIYNLGLNEELQVINIISNILNIVPAFIAELILYVIYVVTNNKFSLDFRGDYLVNVFVNPLLNVDIMAAYIESINFYCFFSNNSANYVKSYGDSEKKADKSCINHYINIAYGICIFVFIIFFIFKFYK